MSLHVVLLGLVVFYATLASSCCRLPESVNADGDGSAVGRAEAPDWTSPQQSAGWVVGFLKSYREELERTTNSDELQEWASTTLRALAAGESRRGVPPSLLPPEACTEPLKRSLISVTAIREEDPERSHVLFLCGSGRGFYGVEIGTREFRPPEDRATRLQWVPGMFVYFIPPL